MLKTCVCGFVKFLHGKNNLDLQWVCRWRHQFWMIISSPTTIATKPNHQIMKLLLIVINTTATEEKSCHCFALGFDLIRFWFMQIILLNNRGLGLGLERKWMPQIITQFQSQIVFFFENKKMPMKRGPKDVRDETKNFGHILKWDYFFQWFQGGSLIIFIIVNVDSKWLWTEKSFRQSENNTS